MHDNVKNHNKRISLYMDEIRERFNMNTEKNIKLKKKLKFIGDEIRPNECVRFMPHSHKIVDIVLDIENENEYIEQTMELIDIQNKTGEHPIINLDNTNFNNIRVMPIENVVVDISNNISNNKYFTATQKYLYQKKIRQIKKSVSCFRVFCCFH